MTTFDGRRPLTGDDLRWKTNFDERRPSMSKPEIEFHVMEEMYAALCMCTCAEKTIFLGKDD